MLYDFDNTFITFFASMQRSKENMEGGQREECLFPGMICGYKEFSGLIKQ